MLTFGSTYFPSKKKITQRPAHSSSFQNYFSDLTQGFWAHPTLQGYRKTWDHSSPSLKGLQPALSLHFKPNIVGYSEVKMQQAPPAVGFPQLTANLLRQREEQALWSGSRCPHWGTTMRSSTYGTKEGLHAQKCICSPPPPTRPASLKRYYLSLQTLPPSSISVHCNLQIPAPPEWQLRP